MNGQKKEPTEAFERFYTTILRLRAPGGCPWDMAQTPLSMRSALIEECFETVDAITAGDNEHAKEEIGDVLLNAVMIASMFEQAGNFSVQDVLDEVTEKLVRRHPHVFPASAGKVCASEAKTADQVLSQWETIKKTVEGRTGASILDEVSAGLPPLLRASKLQKKAAKKGFDWTAAGPVFDKIREELAEVEEAAAESAAADNEREPKAPDGRENLHVEEEIGDLLFAVVNAARHLHVDPETALNRANAKFSRRFRYVEKRMKEEGLPTDSAHLAQMDAFWDEAKKLLDETGKKQVY